MGYKIGFAFFLLLNGVECRRKRPHQANVVDVKRLQPGRLVECMEQAEKASDGQLGFVMGPLYKLAQCEAGLKPGVPKHACLPKWPQSWVEQIRIVTKTNATKVHRYSFVGSVFKNFGSAENREWVFDFAQKYFTANDYFRITGPVINATEYYRAYPDHDSRATLHTMMLNRTDWEWGKEGVKLPSGAYQSYEVLGGFDRTLDGYKATYPFPLYWKKSKYTPVFESQYWKTMGDSCFTLCPDGDQPFSIRFWEAMLAGSIPVVVQDSSAHPENMPRFGGSMIEWKYHIANYTRQNGRLVEDPKWVLDSFDCRQDWIDSNFKQMIKFSTFLNGDNAPRQGIEK